MARDWKKRTDRPFNIDWKSNKVSVLGIWVGDTTNDNFIEQEFKIKNKFQFWKRNRLSLIGKIKVLIVLYYGDFGIELNFKIFQKT